MQPGTDCPVFLCPCRSNTVGDSMQFVESPCSHLNPQPAGPVRCPAPSLAGMPYNDMVFSGFKAGPPLETTVERGCWQMLWRLAAPQNAAPVYILLVSYLQPSQCLETPPGVSVPISCRALAFMRPLGAGARRHSAWQRQGCLFIRSWRLTPQSFLGSRRKLQPLRAS